MGRLKKRRQGKFLQWVAVFIAYLIVTTPLAQAASFFDSNSSDVGILPEQEAVPDTFGAIIGNTWDVQTNTVNDLRITVAGNELVNPTNVLSVPNETRAVDFFDGNKKIMSFLFDFTHGVFPTNGILNVSR
ncbi:MAG: hypothetical protein Q7K43_04190, partial [Candidatus Woesearchaeota archaeon]|nr:hypothetical protein [Candidatus Woesearchaeota archaeon]